MIQAQLGAKVPELQKQRTKCLQRESKARGGLLIVQQAFDQQTKDRIKDSKSISKLQQALTNAPTTKDLMLAAGAGMLFAGGASLAIAIFATR